MNGFITNYETMGSADGPGVRLVLFLAGCKLRCKYCHNPETWCGNGELKEISSQEVLRLYNKYKVYYGTGGGVTFSGGEPLLQTEFVLETVKLLKENGVHVALDTAGVCDNINEELLNLVDLVILDVKATNEKEYKWLTGYEMTDFRRFVTKCLALRKTLWLRQVIVPNVNDDEKHVLELKKFAKSLENARVERIELLPYHSMAKSKYEKLGIPYELASTSDMSREKLKELQNLLK